MENTTTYKGCPGLKAKDTSCSHSIPSLCPNQELIDAGKRTILLAKIAGITPDMFTFNGTCEACPIAIWLGFLLA